MIVVTPVAVNKHHHKAVKCPHCKGHLCDTMATEKAAYSLEHPPSEYRNKIILKCPKCGRYYIIAH